MTLTGLDCTSSAAPAKKRTATSDLIDVVDRVVGSSPGSLSNESSPKTDFIPEPRAETLPPSNYGRKRARVERDNHVSWDKIVFLI